MKNKKKAVIWGAGTLGTSKLLCELLELRYEIVAYCDSDMSKCGMTINGYKVRSIGELVKLNSAQAFDVIIIAIYNTETVLAVRKIIEGQILAIRSVEVHAYSEIGSELESIYISQIHQTLDFTSYNIDYKAQFGIWIDNIMFEVDYWVNSVAKEGARFRDDYCKRLQNDRFQSELSGNIGFLSDYLCGIEEPLVYDIGCGLAPRFGGTLPNGSHICMTAIDPLAYFYNVINEKYAPTGSYKKAVFGMSEYFSCFFARDSADAVIINNALDHCIDPYKSIVESLAVLKPGGVLYLNHTRAEGINEKYHGLHQWNLDYTETEDFIIWNYNAAVNVSQRLGEIADIRLTHIDRNVQVEMTKKKDFDPSQYADAGDGMENMAFMIKGLIEKLSDPTFNSIFNSMLTD